MIGERIKAVRKEKGMTQKEFARALGIKQNSLAVIELGQRNASEQVILAIMREYRVREEWLRNGTGPMFTPEPLDLDALAAKLSEANPAIRELVRRLISLPPEMQAAVVDFLRLPELDSDTRAALHAELDRQLDLEKDTEDASEVS